MGARGSPQHSRPGRFTRILLAQGSHVQPGAMSTCLTSQPRAETHSLPPLCSICQGVSLGSQLELESADGQVPAPQLRHPHPHQLPTPRREETPLSWVGLMAGMWGLKEKTAHDIELHLTQSSQVTPARGTPSHSARRQRCRGSRAQHRVGAGDPNRPNPCPQGRTF